MLDRQQIVDTVLEGWNRWNLADHDGWLKLFHPDIVIDDPVGAPTKHGLEAAEKSWEAGFSLDPWFVVPGPVIVCGNKAAFTASHMSVLGGRPVMIQDVEIWEFADDGRISRVSAYYEPAAGTPDYFLQEP
jgi:steroid delta-isomerase